MSNENPLGQAISLLSRVRDKGLSSATLEAHFSAGLISDLFDVGDPMAIDRDAHRKFLGLSPLEFRALVESGVTIEQMVAAASFDWVNSEINSTNFPVDSNVVGAYRFKIYEPKRDISSQAMVGMMQADGFPAARHEPGIAFGKEFPREQLKRPIALLGSSAEVDGRRCVVCLYRDGTERKLFLSRWDYDWRGRWGFLGAQKVSGA